MSGRAPLDLDLLRSFVAIAETRSFSRAAERLLRNQSTVSLQLKRLEETVGQTLFDRTPRSVRITAQGERLLDHARRMLALNDEILQDLHGPQVEGVVRLGAPEDFATTHLPEALARFAEAHPRVMLEVTCDLTLRLLDAFRAEALDMALVKREISTGQVGVRVWREPLVWVGGPKDPAGFGPTLPLVVSPEPCVYRKRATGALDRAGRPWRVAYVCGSLAGAQAAVRAGLGVAVLPKAMTPPGLRILESAGLPELDDTEVALMTRAPLSPPSQRLYRHIVATLEAGAGR